jgi:hypothetical protein
MTVLAACGGGGDGAPPPAQPVSLSIAGLPSAAMLPGQSAQLTATLVYSDASTKDVTATALWSTTNAGVLSVSSAGAIAAVAPGQAEVVVSTQGLSARGTVTVVAPAPQPASLAISGIPAAPITTGQSAQLTALMTYSDASVKDVTATTVWSTTNSAVLAVSSSGAIQGVAPGQAEVVASAERLSSRATVSVAAGTPQPAQLEIRGMPVKSLAPEQSAQLTAVMTYSDSSVRDVTTTAVWYSTDQDVLTVSAAGLITATRPGNARVFASFGGMSAYVIAEVVVLPAAYFIDGVEYAFDYELDAQGRVDRYRISQREGIAYSTPAASDWYVRECTGSLHGSYFCAGLYTEMTGAEGRLVSVSQNVTAPSSDAYSYGQFGLAEVKVSRRLSTHQSTDSTSTLGYDAAGRLSEVRTSSLIVNWGSETRNTTATIQLDSQGRLSRAGIVTCSSYDGCWEGSAMAWTYDLAGFMSSARTTTYSVDADGWLVSRQEGNIPPDTYAIIRSGGRVAEEQFTQAYPTMFYAWRRSQRVRYEWGRLPTEPLFVPRALTGLKGADYFGIISSHDR